MSNPRLKIALGSFFLLLVIGVPSTSFAAKIHPAVVRVVVPEGNSSTSYGSGTLIAASEKTGIVLTNWHVVRDRKGQVEVVFPNGFRSAARVLRTDRDWDLAALLVWRPAVDPVRIAKRAPRRGEVLSIAGYGKGKYRFATGKFVQYLSPGGDHPFEIVELSAGARQGDSGGPIFNQRGEMAGVLFGSAFGKTSGSHAVRVRNFLSSIDPQLADGRLAPQPHVSQAQYAQNVTPGPRVASEYNAKRLANQQQVPSPSDNRGQEAWIGVPDARPDKTPCPTNPFKIKPAPQWQRGDGSASGQNHPEQNTTDKNRAPEGNVPSESVEPNASAEKNASSNVSGQLEQVNHETPAPQTSELTLWDHIKNVLCLIGGVAILVQVAKLLNPDDPKGKNKGKAKSK